MIAQVVNASNSTILLADEQFLVVVDLLVFRPELDLQVNRQLDQIVPLFWNTFLDTFLGDTFFGEYFLGHFLRILCGATFWASSSGPSFTFR